MIEDAKACRELVKQIVEGETQLFEIVISNTKGLVLSIIYKMIRDPEDRKDLSQEVYLKAFHKLASFNFNSKLSTWIATITYNTCLNYLAKKRIPILNVPEHGDKEFWESIEGQIIQDSESQTEAYIYEKENAEIIFSEIEKLPLLYKTIITLYHKQELSYKEIAMITNLPVGTLKSYLYRARKQLKTNLLMKYNKEDL